MITKADVRALMRAVSAYFSELIGAERERVDKLFAALPPALDEMVFTERAARAAAALIPKPQDGHSVTVAELEPVIASEVARAVAALPAAEPGKDGASVTLDDVAPLIAKAVAALPPAAPGRDADPEVVHAMVKEAVAAAVAALPPAPAGKDADPNLMRMEIAKLFSAIPAPKDGKSVTAEEVATALLPALDGLFAKWALDVERRFNDQARAALANIPKPKDGVDGFDLDDLQIEHDGERTLTLRFKSGDLVREKSFRIDSLIDRGVWREGTYEKGDGVTWAGSFWIAQRATQSKPQTDDSWRLAVKKGRDA